MTADVGFPMDCVVEELAAAPVILAGNVTCWSKLLTGTAGGTR